MPLLVIIAGLFMWWFGLLPSGAAYTYAPEVGYYQGKESIWFVGTAVPSRDKCVSTAVAVYNQYNYENPGRAFSWACRQMQGDRFLARVR